jgi:hypothetical protein
MADKKLATVDPISDKISWNAHAALGDALERCPIGADLVVVWMTPENTLHWSKATTNAMAVYMLQAASHKVIFDP